MISKHTTLIFLFLGFFYKSQAQEVTKNDTVNGTELKTTMDSRIDNIISGIEDKCNRPIDSNSTNTEDDRPIIKTSTTPRITVPKAPVTNADICRQNPRILGYKIQLVIVKSNDEANEVKAYFRRRFPNLKAETDASLRPNYKVLVGSYFTKESASRDLAAIRGYFKSAIPIQYRVFRVEAK